ncbi:MAG: carbamoyl-phosphate synthase large subunit, partial [Candidatus Omnitrophica bacterium]|nr:carbamoyl-phosphate synthase large subunit [Candidatus Omnitrophota bacterium]
DEVKTTKKKKIIILGGGPNRIGQGIEFDYCCCHASFALKEIGFETIMVNSNPETVSTDYDTSDRLYFEPLTFEDVMNIIDKEKPDGVIVQLGGQTPLNLARQLEKAGAPIIGTSVESIDRAENRDKFAKVLNKLKISQPENGAAILKDEIIKIAKSIGFPVLVRPSYVLGGRAMKIVYDAKTLSGFIKEAQEASVGHPVLIDKFLEDAVEVDVDAVSDGKITVIGGIMEHIEEAGVHSGDSACVIPAHTLGDDIIEVIRKHTYALAKELKVKGLINIQFAIKGEQVYVLEVNPRASRTVPFVSKAIGVALAKIAAKVMAGKTLKQLGFTKEKKVDYVSVKESVLPFSRFSGVDILLGPEMKSTGEVMGIDSSFGRAFYKSQLAANQNLPLKGKIFISVKNSDKRDIVFIAKKLSDMNFQLIATKGTYKALVSNNIKVRLAGKISEGDNQILELIKKGELKLIINTPSGPRGQSDMKPIRGLAVTYGLPCITTIQGAQAAVNGIESIKKGSLKVKSIQEYHKKKGAG